VAVSSERWQRWLLPLHWLVPLATLLSSALASWAYHEIALMEVQRRLVSAAKQDLRSQALLIVNEMEHALQRNDVSQLQSLMGLFGAKRGLVAAALFDPEGRVLAATRMAWTHGIADARLQRWRRWLREPPPQLALRFDAARLLVQVAAPVVFPSSRLGKPRRGLFIAERSLRWDWQVAKSDVVAQAGAFFVVMLLFAILGAFTFEVGVRARMQRIVRAAKRFAQGELSARSHVFGRDEIGRIGEAFDAMAARLQREHDRLRTLHEAIEHMAEAVMITDQVGTILYVNPAFSRITGYAREEAIGRTPRLLKSGRMPKGFYREMWQTIRAGRVWSGRLVNRRKDGSSFPAIETIAPILSSSGEVVRFVAVMQDISEMERLEQKLAEAQKMEALGTLVGGVAHDFNNMLAGITGNLYLIKMRLSERDRGLVERIERLADRAAEMIRQMLAFARQDAVHFQCFDLGAFVKEAMRTSRVIVPETVQLDLEVQTGLTVCADATQLQQMLMNLLSNARDAVQGVPAPRIFVRAVRYEADEDFLSRHPEAEVRHWALLAVQDNGCGMDEATKKRIFDPFFTTKEVGKGTGLGLAMVHGAMQRHGGVIEVDSTPGAGSEFRLFFPLVEASIVEDVTPSEQSDGYGRGERILIADDEPAVRTVLAEILEHAGYRVQQAEDGTQAWAMFERDPEAIDLALLDVVMPGKNGVELAHEMRRLRPELPVIWITGYDREHVLHEELPPKSLLLSKPVHARELLRALRELLHHKAR